MIKFGSEQGEVNTIYYITLDLEWNQAERRHAKANLQFEIIEVGAVKLDEHWNVVDHFSMLVKPRVYPHLFPKVLEIVNITENELHRKGKPFATVMKQFWDWCSSTGEYLLCTWGSMDITELLRNIQYYHLKCPLQHPVFYSDIQKIYSLQYSNGKKRCSLEAAADELQLTETLQFHRAHADAYYTALIMQQLDRHLVDMYLSLDYFHLPANASEEVHMVFDTYSKYVSRVFPDKEAAFADKEVISCTCYLCNTNIKKTIPWFSYLGRYYYCGGKCPTHGWVRSKIRLKKADSEHRVYVVKTTKVVLQSDIDDILEKREEVREKRRKHLETSDPQNTPAAEKK